AKLIIYMADALQYYDDIASQITGLEKQDIPYLLLINKADLLNAEQKERLQALPVPVHFISAQSRAGVEELKDSLLKTVNVKNLNTNQTILNKIRHVEALQNTEAALKRVLENVDNPITSDLLAMDIKQALHYLGEIVGEVTTDDLLENIL